MWRLNAEMVRLREEIRLMGEKYERIRKEKEEMNEVIKEKENEIKNMSKIPDMLGMSFFCFFC